MATSAPIADVSRSRPQRAFHERRARLWRMGNWQTGRAYRSVDKALTNDRAFAVVVACCLLFQATLIWNHSAWLDEWQALLIAVQTPTLDTLLASLRFEGHPPLWYAFLRGLAAAIPFEHVLAVAALATALTLQSLILLAAPFARSERLMLALGEIALFEYGTIARSLALGALTMTAVAALWHRRAVWLAIAMLPLCDFLFGVVALILIALRARDRALSIPGLSLFTATSLFAAWSVRPGKGLVPAEVVGPTTVELGEFLLRLGGLILPFQTFGGRVAWDGYPPFLLGIPLGAAFLIWMWRRFDEDKLQKAGVFALLGLCLVMSVAVYPLHFRHLTVIAWLVVVLAWIAPLSSSVERKRWRLWLAIGAASGLATSAVALTRPFDAAPRVAAAMASLDDGKTRWLAFPPSRIPALAAQTRLPIVSPAKGCSETFVRWDHVHPTAKPQALRRALRAWASTYGRSYIILEWVPRKVPRDVFQRLTPTMVGYNGQRYVIGVLAPTSPAKVLDTPPCVPGLRPLR